MKLKLNDLTVFTFLLIYTVYQIYLTFLGGATYDLFEQWLGAGYIFEKLQAYKNLEFTNVIFDQELNTYDFFGYFFMFPAYVFERIINKVSYGILNEPLNSIATIFLDEDGLTFFSLHLFLIIYSLVCLIIIYKKIENIYNKKLSLLFLFILLCIPSFSGHLIFNIKDIPFLFQLFIAKLFIYDYMVNDLDNLKYKETAFLGFLIAASMSIRINALLFILFFLFYLLLITGNKKKYCINIIKIFTFSTLFLLAMNPQSWKDHPYFGFFQVWTFSLITHGQGTLLQMVNISMLKTCKERI